MKGRRLEVLLTILLLPIGVIASDSSASACPVTTGSPDLFGESFPTSEIWFGSEILAVILSPNGTINGRPDDNFRSKLFLWSNGFRPGFESNLKIIGRRLDDKSVVPSFFVPTHTYHEAFGQWVMLVELEFPGAGCWKITAEYFGQRISLITRVQASEVDAT